PAIGEARTHRGRRMSAQINRVGKHYRAEWTLQFDAIDLTRHRARGRKCFSWQRRRQEQIETLEDAANPFVELQPDSISLPIMTPGQMARGLGAAQKPAPEFVAMLVDVIPQSRERLRCPESSPNLSGLRHLVIDDGDLVSH